MQGNIIWRCNYGKDFLDTGNGSAVIRLTYNDCP
jgi:hypothetical protein